MILTGAEIKESIRRGEIKLDPFDPEQVNPNSYNYRLGSKLKVFKEIKDDIQIFEDVVIPEEGYILEPHQMYLGHTAETIGSNKYAMSLIGRSSIGRLGLFLQISANLGHTTSSHKWTLEMVSVKPLKIYPYMKIGQVSFWENCGELMPDQFTYANFNAPQEAYIRHNNILGVS